MKIQIQVQNRLEIFKIYINRISNNRQENKLK